MGQTRANGQHEWRGRLAGWLLIVGSAVMFAFPQVDISLTALKEGPHYLGFLVVSVPIALVISLPVLFVGRYVLRRDAKARWIGIGMALVGSLVFGQLLASQVRTTSNLHSWSTGWPYIVLWAVLLAISVVVVLALVTAGSFFRSGDEELAPSKPMPGA